MEGNMKVNKNNIWSTADFYSAVIVRASGIPLIDLVKEQGKFVTFYFNAHADVCEMLLKKHWDRSLKLETRLFIETISELKVRIHERVKSLSTEREQR